jgi:hypothetical protein
LLKSVAESQGKLLAGLNALESKLDNLHGIVEHNAMEQSAKLDGLRDGLASEIALLRQTFDKARGEAMYKYLVESTLKDLGAKAPSKRPSTKRKPRGRRK